MIINKTLATSTAAYSAGDAIGSLNTLGGSAFDEPGYWKLNSITVKDHERKNPGANIYLMNTKPAYTGITDNWSFDLTRNDQNNVVAIASVASNAYLNMSTGAYQFLDLKGQNISGAGGNIYAVMQAVSAPTFASTSAISLAFNFSRE